MTLAAHIVGVVIFQDADSSRITANAHLDDLKLRPGLLADILVVDRILVQFAGHGFNNRIDYDSRLSRMRIVAQVAVKRVLRLLKERDVSCCEVISFRIRLVAGAVLEDIVRCLANQTAGFLSGFSAFVRSPSHSDQVPFVQETFFRMDIFERIPMVFNCFTLIGLIFVHKSAVGAIGHEIGHNADMESRQAILDFKRPSVDRILDVRIRGVSAFLRPHVVVFWVH